MPEALPSMLYRQTTINETASDGVAVFGKRRKHCSNRAACQISKSIRKIDMDFLWTCG